MRALRPKINAGSGRPGVTLAGLVRDERRARDLAARIEQYDAVEDLAHTKGQQNGAARKAREARYELIRLRLRGEMSDKALADRLADWAQGEGLRPDALARLAHVLNDRPGGPR